MQSVNVSFCGCGFLSPYQIGVALCFREHSHLIRIDKVAGSSAGALNGAFLLCGTDFGDVMLDGFQLAASATRSWLGPLSPAFDMVSEVRDGLRNNLPADAHLTCSGRLHVSLTRVRDSVNVIVSHFPNKEDLIQALICSCFIPYISGLVPPLYRGRRYWDGGITDNQPIFDSRTITVSPFSGESSDIAPRDRTSASFVDLSMSNQSFRWTSSNFARLSHALRPTTESMRKTCKDGYDDALRFLRTFASTELINPLALANLSDAAPLDNTQASSLPPKDTALSDSTPVVVELINMPTVFSNVIDQASIADFLRPSTVHNSDRVWALLPRDTSYAIKLLQLLSQSGSAIIRNGQRAAQSRATAFRAISSFNSAVKVAFHSLLLEGMESGWTRRYFLRNKQMGDRSELRKAATVAADMSTISGNSSSFRRTESVPAVNDDAENNEQRSKPCCADQS